ncbi:MAG TPA: hypothetical protein VH351_19920 [Bryobacteraceae bacterium]|jgi:hypothetical protein|nr:hypothetical protein [Bryobacteraceae bacterium]
MGRVLIEVGALLLSWALGLSFIKPLFDLSSASVKLLWIALGWTFGALLSSVIWFLLCIWPALPAFYAVAFEVLLLWLFWFRGRKYVFRTSGPLIAASAASESAWTRAVIALAVICFLLFAVNFAIASRQTPDGNWDAWAIWNMHARVLYRAPLAWRTVLPLLTYSHPDYPGLQPITIARLWSLAGDDSPSAPILVQFAFGAAPVLLVASSLAVLKSWAHGAIAAIFLLGTTYTSVATWQYADPTVSLFIAASFVLLVCYRRSGERSLLFLAGMSAGAAAWVKNEGGLFVACLVLTGMILWMRSNERRRALLDARPFVYGLVIPLACVFVFKRLIAWHSDVMTWTSEWHQWAVGLTTKRVWTILRAYWNTAWKMDRWTIPPLLWLLLFMDTAGVETSKTLRRDARRGLAVLGLMLLGYIIIYATSAQDLNWYLSTSLQRLFLQMWPAFLFLIFLFVRVPIRAFECRFGTSQSFVSKRNQERIKI